jgi:diguanylate cyclase
MDVKKESFAGQLSTTLVAAENIEQLVRPLLVLLQRVTQLHSVYLTQVHHQAEEQQVLFSLNSKAMEIPEGLHVPWGDTLCKRALEQGQAFTDDASLCWGDSEAAKALGICTYVSTPIYYADGILFGTLCAAADEVCHLTQEGQGTVSLFGALIQQYVQREKLIDELRQSNLLLQAQSYRDPLTDLPNRRLILMELRRLMALAKREERTIYVVFIDLDGFKQINDQYGHEIGDAFLVEVGRRLAKGVRSHDLLGRLGGDEFVIVVMGDPNGEDQLLSMDELHQRLAVLIQGRFDLGSVCLDYAGASFGVINAEIDACEPEELLRRADAAMYVQKQARKACMR